MIVWLNGALADAEDARINPRDRGFLLSDGLFETLLALDGRLAFFDAHYARFAAGANTLGIPLPLSADALAAACADVLNANGLTDAARASLRITLTRGAGPRGLAPPPDPKPALLITAAHAPPPPASMTAMVATVRRNEHSPAANLKTLAYLDNVLAKREAMTAGYDDALLLNGAGHLAEASAANLFVWDGDRLLTPPVSDGVLPGVVRAVVLDLARDLGIDASEETVTPDRLASATGAFLTNSLIGLCPLTCLGDAALPAHALTARLASAYKAALDRST